MQRALTVLVTTHVLVSLVILVMGKHAQTLTNAPFVYITVHMVPIVKTTQEASIAHVDQVSLEMADLVTM